MVDTNFYIDSFIIILYISQSFLLDEKWDKTVLVPLLV
jgi:hypothetical protein